jgi:hypothetical protein
MFVLLHVGRSHAYCSSTLIDDVDPVGFTCTNILIGRADMQISKTAIIMHAKGQTAMLPPSILE